MQVLFFLTQGLFQVDVSENAQNPFYTLLSKPIDYNIPPQGFQSVACTPSLISAFIFDENSRPTTGIMYTIKTHRSGSSIVFTISFDLQIFEWTSVKISYLVSSRSDFSLGYFIPGKIYF